MNYKKYILIRFAGICGIISPIIIFSGIIFSILLSPWFHWTTNYLSDLAGKPFASSIWAARGISSLIFNISFFSGGIIGLIFAIGLVKSKILKKCVCRFGSLFLILDMIALTAIGIFPLTTGEMHILISYTFFILVPFFLLIIGFRLRITDEKRLGLIAILLGTITLISFPFFPFPKPWGHNAIIESFSLLSISLFNIIFGFRLIKWSFDLKKLKADKKRIDI